MENEDLHKKIIQWGCKQLLILGYRLKSHLPETVQNTPWSYVIRFATTDGYLYLKSTPVQLALEANIIQLLHDHFHASVPIIIAHSPELNCFLMKDAGRLLREILKQQFDTALYCKAIDQFTSLQIATADRIDVFETINSFYDGATVKKSFVFPKDLKLKNRPFKAYEDNFGG